MTLYSHISTSTVFFASERFCYQNKQKFFVKRPDVIAVAGSNLLECLSGLPVEEEFISFTDIFLFNQ
jgi:hypothetical protein